MNKRIGKKMYKELMEIYKHTDYSTYYISVGYDSEENILLIPKPVMALALVDASFQIKLNKAINKHPFCRIMVA